MNFWNILNRNFLMFLKLLNVTWLCGVRYLDDVFAITDKNIPPEELLNFLHKFVPSIIFTLENPFNLALYDVIVNKTVSFKVT